MLVSVIVGEDVGCAYYLFLVCSSLCVLLWRDLCMVCRFLSRVGGVLRKPWTSP